MSDNDNMGTGDNRIFFPRQENIPIESRIDRLGDGLEEVAHTIIENDKDILETLKITAEKLVELEQLTLSKNNELDQNFEKLYHYNKKILDKMQGTVDTEQDRKKIQEDIAEMEQHLKKTNDRIKGLCIVGLVLYLPILAGLLALLNAFKLL